MNASLCIVLGPNSHSLIILIFAALYFLCFADANDAVNDYQVWIGWLLHNYLFFVTGHRTNFSQISWKAAYIGGVEYNFVRALVLTVLHQISGHLFAFLFVPILIMYKSANMNQIRQNVNKYVYASIAFS